VRRKLIPVATVLLLDAGLALAQTPAQITTMPNGAGGNGVLLPPVMAPSNSSLSPWPITSAGTGSGETAAPLQNPPVPAPPSALHVDPTAPSNGTYFPQAHARSAFDSTFVVSAEYLLWTVRGGVPPEVSAVLTNDQTDGNSLVHSLHLNGWESGARVFVRWAPSGDCWFSCEVGGFFLADTRGSFDAAVLSHPAASPTLVPASLILHPVINGVIDVPNSRGIVDTPIPGPDGEVDLDPSDMLVSHLHGTAQRQLWGLEANLRSRALYLGAMRFDCLAGFRNLNLREKLSVQGDFTFSEPLVDQDEGPNNPEDGHTNVMHTFDSVDVRNNFYGGQVGFSFETIVCKGLTVSGFAKIALGGNSEYIQQVGSTLMDATTIETNAGGPFIPRPSTLLPGGLFTPQNVGGTSNHSSHFSVLPELNINVGYQMTNHLQGYVGFNYLYMSNVARIGSLSPDASASNQGHLETYGVDFGLQLRF
jgi:Putative beta barrel porin-7 (BBP7)